MRQKRDILAVVYKTKDSHFNIKNTSLIDTDEKGKFIRMLSFFFVRPRKAFLYKITLREVFDIFFMLHHLMDCFETQPSSEVFEESEVHFVLYSQESYVFYLKGNLFL